MDTLDTVFAKGIRSRQQTRSSYCAGKNASTGARSPRVVREGVNLDLEGDPDALVRVPQVERRFELALRLEEKFQLGRAYAEQRKRHDRVATSARGEPRRPRNCRGRDFARPKLAASVTAPLRSETYSGQCKKAGSSCALLAATAQISEQ